MALILTTSDLSHVTVDQCILIVTNNVTVNTDYPGKLAKCVMN